MARSRSPSSAVCGSCPRCGRCVLTGATPVGQSVILDVHIATYTVVWAATAQPTLYVSRGYPVHQCAATNGAEQTRLSSAPARILRKEHNG
jgi:hypothetical protein